MPYTGSPPTFTTGQKTGVAAGLNDLRDFARAFTDAWSAYTPTLTASTTNPTGWTATGYYMRAGKLVVCRFMLTAGAGVTAGSGQYRIALPANSTTTQPYALGAADLFDSSTGNGCTSAQVYISASTYATIRYTSAYPVGAAIVVGATAPWTWAASDTIWGQITYEAA